MKKKYPIVALLFIFIILYLIFNYKCDYVVSIAKIKFINIDLLKCKDEQMSKIKDIIIGNKYFIALSENGDVWSWGEDENGKLGLGEIIKSDKPIRIKELNNILKIFDVGACIYALSADGFIYAWGSNSIKTISIIEDFNKVFFTPIKLHELENIIDLDAKNNKAFALDSDGKFYIWGIELYKDELNNMIPSFPIQHNSLLGNINSIIVGAGNYNYIIKEDGSILSILEYKTNGLISPYAFILPYNIYTHESISRLELFENVIILNNEYTKFGYTILYELKGMTDVEKIGADEYTMFIYKNDDTLWYWNSNRVKFHDDIWLLFRPETSFEDYSGYFEEININEILNYNDKDIIPKIVDIKCSKENTMFLTNTGEVFISEYKNYSVEDIEYFVGIERRGRFGSAREIEKDVSLKKLEFKKLDIKDIISINVDNRMNYFNNNYLEENYVSNFSAVDSDGNYYHWNPNTFHIKHYKNN